MGSALTVVSVYPDLLGTYADTGNVTVLRRRLERRGLPVQVVEVRSGEAVPTGGDLYVLGGGEDDAQLQALPGLRRSLPAAVAAGAAVFAVCAGLQLLGADLEVDGRLVAGLGLLDATTRRLGRRVVGEVLAVPAPDGLPTITGFANHGGGTVLGPAATALATTVAGRGNDGTERSAEGAVQGAVVGTYLHGPVLARNPALADWLLARVTGGPLAALPDGPSEQLWRERTGPRAAAGGRWRRRQPSARSTARAWTNAV